MSDTICVPDMDTDTDTDTQRQPPYAVIVENDDDHTVEYVIELLTKVFHYPIEKCVKLTRQVHEEGRSIVWSGSKEVAEFHCERIKSGGADFYAQKTVTYPLGCYIEPMA